MRRLHTIIVFALVVMLSSTAWSQKSRVVIDEYQVSKWVTDNKNALNIPSIAVGIVGPDRDYYLELYGPAEAADPFLIGSLSKSVTATAVMLLVHDEKLSLDDPVTKWVKGAREGVTIEHLLYQTSGLDRADGGAGWTDLDATIDQMVADSSWEAPGEYAYSNLNYQLLGHVVSQVSGQSYADFVQQRIFDPLGMKDSTAEPGVPDDNRVIGHQYIYGFPVAFGEPDYNPRTVPSGFVWMSANDMATWLRVFVNEGKKADEQVIPADVIRRLLEKPGDTSYAMGWLITSSSGPTIAKHSGATGAFTSAMSVVPERDFGVFVLTNLNCWMALGPTNVMDGILASILGTEKPSATNLEFILRLAFGIFVAVIILTFLFELMRWLRIRSFQLTRKHRNAVILTVAINVAIVVGVVYYFGTPIPVIVTTQPDIGAGFLITVILGPIRRLLTGFNKTVAERLVDELD